MRWATSKFLKGARKNTCNMPYCSFRYQFHIGFISVLYRFYIGFISVLCISVLYRFYVYRFYIVTSAGLVVLLEGDHIFTICLLALMSSHPRMSPTLTHSALSYPVSLKYPSNPTPSTDVPLYGCASIRMCLYTDVPQSYALNRCASSVIACSNRNCIS